MHGHTRIYQNTAACLVLLSTSLFPEITVSLFYGCAPLLWRVRGEGAARAAAGFLLTCGLTLLPTLFKCVFKLCKHRSITLPSLQLPHAVPSSSVPQFPGEQWGMTTPFPPYPFCSFPTALLFSRGRSDPALQCHLGCRACFSCQLSGCFGRSPWAGRQAQLPAGRGWPCPCWQRAGSRGEKGQESGL